MIRRRKKQQHQSDDNKIRIYNNDCQSCDAFLAGVYTAIIVNYA